ncbi:MAG: hypothetical protein ACLQVL_05235 [Terriglobia bacterium]
MNGTSAKMAGKRASQNVKSDRVLGEGVGRLLVAICLLTTFALAQQADTQGAQGLPKGILKAMAGDEKDYCDQWLGSYRKGCHEKFRQNLWWRRLLITPSGKMGVLAENRNMGACGSAGCSLSLFAEVAKGAFTQVLGQQGDVGNVARVNVLKTVTNGYYDLQKTWADGETTTLYKWNGRRYSSVN